MTGRPCTWPAVPGDWTTSRRIQRADAEPLADHEVWLGARYAPANDNRQPAIPVRREDDGPTPDYAARKAKPGTTRRYSGDIPARLAAEGECELVLMCRALGALLAAGDLAANDNVPAEGYGHDYAIEQPSAERAVKLLEESGELPDGRLEFRRRSGNPAGPNSLTAAHRRAEKAGDSVDWYLSLRGAVAPLGAPPAPVSPVVAGGYRAPPKRAERELARLLDGDLSNVRWWFCAPGRARHYGAMGINSEVKGGGEGRTSAPAHAALQEIDRRAAEHDLRARVSPRAMRVIDAVLACAGYSDIARAEGLSRSGAKKAVKAALREGWEILMGITEEKMPERRNKNAS